MKPLGSTRPGRTREAVGHLTGNADMGDTHL